MKLASKRYNERLKLAVSALNTLGLALIISGAIYPLVKGDSAILNFLIWISAGIALHITAQVLLGGLKSED